jgi:hypothetical protein
MFSDGEGVPSFSTILAGVGKRISNVDMLTYGFSGCVLLGYSCIECYGCFFSQTWRIGSYDVHLSFSAFVELDRIFL